VTGFGQYGEWAHSTLGSNNIEGSLNPANPGNAVDGSAMFETAFPDGILTVTWHLVHDGPITLPHD